MVVRTLTNQLFIAIFNKETNQLHGYTVDIGQTHVDRNGNPISSESKTHTGNGEASWLEPCNWFPLSVPNMDRFTSIIIKEPSVLQPLHEWKPYAHAHNMIMYLHVVAVDCGRYLAVHESRHDMCCHEPWMHVVCSGFPWSTGSIILIQQCPFFAVLVCVCVSACVPCDFLLTGMFVTSR